ncbi:MAG: xanthine dehydrogenase family protein molybdopterin-binding subunit, partial [Steroidobacteraceae bacterium]
MTVTDVMRSLAKHAPDSLVPGARPAPVPDSMTTLGRPISRVDGALKVQGKARFSAEVAMDGLLYAALVHSTIPRGRIASLDTSAAEASPGVALVMTHRNAPRMNPPPAFVKDKDGAAGSDLPVMQDDSIHWNGEVIAVVLAETQEQADHAASRVRATYSTQPAVTDFQAAHFHA